MTTLRRLVHRRSWPEPPVTEPLDEVLYAPRDLGLPFTQCKGIWIGGCIANERAPWGLWRIGGRLVAASSGAHAHWTGPNTGVICVAHDGLLWEKGSWAPRELMWHEYAHVLVGNEDEISNDHDPLSKWAAVMSSWGLIPSRWS